MHCPIVFDEISQLRCFLWKAATNSVRITTADGYASYKHRSNLLYFNQRAETFSAILSPSTLLYSCVIAKRVFTGLRAL
jgi:hypothetical protein